MSDMFESFGRMLFFLCLLPILLSCNAESSITAVDLTCEYLEEPMGLDVESPRFSWKLQADSRDAYNLFQKSYHIQVSRNAGFGEKDLIWDTGWVVSDKSLLISYEGPALVSDRKYFWRVRVKDQNLKEAPWSKAASWTTGLFSQNEWSAEWVGGKQIYDETSSEVCNIYDPWFRKTFYLKGKPVQANLFLASVGYHELYVNGKHVEEASVLAPAVTDHSKRARYIAYDIAEYLEKGKNAVAVWLGTSWSIFRPYRVDTRPETPIFIAQADIYSTGGNLEMRLASDSSWKTHDSPNRLLGSWGMRNMGGEIYDANKEIEGWNTTDFIDTEWKEATVYRPELRLSAQKIEKNILGDKLIPIEIAQKNDTVRIDMGRNFSGWAQINLSGQPGDSITVMFSESKDKAVTFNMRSIYILGASGKGVFRNRFNYGVGRWITVVGGDGRISKSDVTGWNIRTGYKAAAGFETSDSLQNWIYDTVIWTFKNLSLGGYVVDCPHRERLGYGGDAHATSETGMANFSMGAFYTKWLEDWRDAQGRESNMGERTGGGVVPHTAPTNNGGGGPAWGGIVVTLPWLMYHQYDDSRVLQENFELISGWLDFLHSKTEGGLLKRFGGEWDYLSDWLWPGANEEGHNNDKPESECFNSAYYAFNLAVASEIADILGRGKDAWRWKKEAGTVRDAIHAKYYNPDDSTYSDGSMANMAMALLAGVPPQSLYQAAYKKLEHIITVERKGHIWAGITGGAMLFKLLRGMGRDDLLYGMTSKVTYPGWGYMRDNGETTIREMWEEDYPWHSHLHSSYLYPGAWYIDGLGGIRQDYGSPGYKNFIIKVPDIKDITWVKAWYDSPSGLIESSWHNSLEGLSLKVRVPPNTSAEIAIPCPLSSYVKVNPRKCAEYTGSECGYESFKVNSGYYVFTVLED